MSRDEQTMASAEYGIILVTVDTQAAAQEIATILVTDRLAACVNLFPIHSVYRWEGKVEEAAEWQLVAKTKLSLFEAIESAVKNLHPYEVPEVLAVPIEQGYVPYLNWLGQNTRT